MAHSCETPVTYAGLDFLKNNQAEEAARLILRSVGEDLSREGIERTPERFSKAICELTTGYQGSPEEVVGQGIFAAEGSGLVSVRNVEFYSLCEHHLLPFWGKASVAYFPQEKILGLSKIPRLIDLFARRFQVQERLTKQVAESVWSLTRPKAVAVRLEASHLCMMMRGVEKQHSNTASEFQLGTENLSPFELERLMSSLL